MVGDFIISGLIIEARMLHSVAGDLSIVIREPKPKGIVGFPIHKGVMGRKWECCTTQRINMRSHPVICLFGNESAKLHLLVLVLLLLL